MARLDCFRYCNYRYEKEDLDREWEWSLETFQTEMTALVYF